MPELPEVETVRRTLEPAIGATIVEVWDSGKGLHMAKKPPRKKLRALAGATITRIHRHGKYLLIETDKQTLLVHLGMTGRTLIVAKTTPKPKHTHMVIDLGERELRFVDPRRFGQIDVVEPGKESEHDGLALLGPDGLFEPATGEYLFQKSRKKNVSLKAFVLDQSIIAGVGNIYASEALWRAKLRPTTRAKRLTLAKATELAVAIHEVFDRALTQGGTSLRDFVNAYGGEGNNAAYLWVYGREGEPCERDQTKIRRSVLQGRATFYCPTCQTG
jgi:formamidopyrimidine-DNA glycosylase